jgi:hypothetical protein
VRLRLLRDSGRDKNSCMTRIARIVVPDCPHHVTARGNRREPLFFEDGNQKIYRDLLSEQVRAARVEIWAYCLMPNHVHLISGARYVGLYPVRARARPAAASVMDKLPPDSVAGFRSKNVSLNPF